MTLAADVMFVNEVSFVVTLLRRFKFYTVEHIPQSGPVLADSLKHILKVYTQGEYIVKVILFDMEFEKLWMKMIWLL